jgi:hypothetical protein
MNILKIYDNYSLPQNLQEHQLRVAALGSIICNHLIEVKVDQSLIVRCLLLHDMGNILKYDFSKTMLFSEKDQNKINFYKLKQTEFKNKYGSKTDEATLRIIKEITTDKRVFTLCKNSHWESANKFVNTNHWDRKIACYSDMRVGPHGVLNLKDRFRDLIMRRLDKNNKLMILCQYGITLENNLQKQTDIDITNLNDASLETVMEKLKETDV